MELRKRRMTAARANNAILKGRAAIGRDCFSAASAAINAAVRSGPDAVALLGGAAADALVEDGGTLTPLDVRTYSMRASNDSRDSRQNRRESSIEWRRASGARTSGRSVGDGISAPSTSTGITTPGLVTAASTSMETKSWGS